MKVIDYHPDSVESNQLARTSKSSGGLKKLVQVAEAAESFAGAARSDSTRRSYARQWRAFSTWCREHDLSALPAAPESVALYLTTCAQRGLRVATLSQALVAISQAHKIAGHAVPTGAPAVQQVWKGIRRKCGTAQRRVMPLVIEMLRAVVSQLPPTTIGARDRALIVLGTAGGFRRSELVALNFEDVAFTPDGLIVVVRRSKTDQEAAGAKVGILFGSNPATCPVRALRAWLHSAGVESGPLFRSMRSGGKIGERLTGADVARIIKKWVAAAGFDSTQFSGHSLRSGMATNAARAGSNDQAILRQGRWTTRAMLDRYVREANLLDADNHAMARVGF